MLHVENILEKAKQNTDFRQVLVTGKNVQIVIMSIPAGGEIGMETHKENDQTLMLVSGTGKVIIDDETAKFETGDIVLVHAGAKHNFIADDNAEMKIITSYSPPHHPDGTVHKTKADADAASAAKANKTAATTAATFQAL
jgi:mannose-6-phosphate isomerase-like protein (cupin superfamily)